jgi:hypothetical protein
MRRRQFIAGLGASVAAPTVARAQQPLVPVIGFLNSGLPDPFASLLATFRQGLKDGGYVEGQNVAIEYRWAESQADRLPALAADLVRRRVAVTAPRQRSRRRQRPRPYQSSFKPAVTRSHWVLSRSAGTATVLL